jgi:myo-inositol-1(or 4)-monophosphatase
MNHPDFALELLAVARKAAAAGAEVLATRNGEALDVSN